jgi:hypothetical protein
MVYQFKIRPMTPRKRAYIEDQRERNVSAAFARLERALDNMARPAWGRSTPDRLAYLQAKFDRRVAYSGSRLAAATLIEEWRQRSLAGGPKLGPDRPIDELTDGEIARALSERRYGQHVAKADLRPPPPKPARAPRKSPKVPKGMKLGDQKSGAPRGGVDVRCFGSSPGGSRSGRRSSQSDAVGAADG